MRVVFHTETIRVVWHESSLSPEASSLTASQDGGWAGSDTILASCLWSFFQYNF